MVNFFTPQLVAELTLLGMGLDVLGGCYLAYDLLGGKRGPLRTMARAIGYMALFFIGYAIVLGLRYAIVAATGMGILLAIEYRLAGINLGQNRESRGAVLLFGFLRGLVLGLAGMTAAGLVFGAVFGVLSGVALVISYALGFSPTHDYEANSKPRTSIHKILASFWRAVAVGLAGVIAVLPRHHELSVLFGLRLGLAAGTVSALVGLFSPVVKWWIENLPERRLGVFGVVPILMGVMFQSIEHSLVVLGPPVH
jgi:hypothetical protein